MYLPERLHYKQYVTRGQFFLKVNLVSIQSFPSLRLVASPKVKNLIGPTIFPWQ